MFTGIYFCRQMSTTTELEMNHSGMTFAYPSDVTELSGEDYAECDDVTCVLTTPEPLDLSVCERLAPPPVPPWLQDAPSRLHEMTRHCRSWTLYQGQQLLSQSLYIYRMYIW